jgi:hypothetical protein
MVRKLKHHEQKLLKKVDFITWKQDNDHRDKQIIRRYMIQKPEDYHRYNRICGVSFHHLPQYLLHLPPGLPWEASSTTKLTMYAPTVPPSTRASSLSPPSGQRGPPET